MGTTKTEYWVDQDNAEKIESKLLELQSEKARLTQKIWTDSQRIIDDRMIFLSRLAHTAPFITQPDCYKKLANMMIAEGKKEDAQGVEAELQKLSKELRACESAIDQLIAKKQGLVKQILKK